MIPLRQAISSSIGKKLITALTGIGLVVFVILHLLGNLQLYKMDGTSFNSYGEMLHNFGPLFYVGEIGLLILFLAHIINGIRLKKNHLDARKTGYRVHKSKGGPTKWNFSSRYMIISGLVLLGFLILHIIQFRLGPGIEQGYVVDIQGRQVHDLHRVVVEVFKNPLVVGFYVISMLFLGAHMRHGIWSAFQSIGAISPRTSAPLTVLGVVLTVLLSAGFLFIPVWIYLHNSGALQ